MPPKKKEKKADAGGGGGELDADAKLKFFMITCQSLQVQLAERTEESSKALAAKRELQARVEQINRDCQDERSATFEITQDMTRQYKSMQEELLNRINLLEESVQSLNDQLADADVRQERLLKDKNAIIQMKDDEIAELKNKMDDMAEEVCVCVYCVCVCARVCDSLSCTHSH